MNGYIVKGIGGFYYVKTPDDIVESLKQMNVDALTPLEALNTLYDLHMRAKLR